MEFVKAVDPPPPLNELTDLLISKCITSTVSQMEASTIPSIRPRFARRATGKFILGVKELQSQSDWSEALAGKKISELVDGPSYFF